MIRFGIGLVGPGRIALRNPELRTAEPAPRSRPAPPDQTAQAPTAPG